MNGSRVCCDQLQLSSTRGPDVAPTGRLPSMICDFSFESNALFSVGGATSLTAAHPRPDLQLPLRIPGELLQLGAVAPSLEATIRHFAPLQLIWKINGEPGAGTRATATLEAHQATGGTWELCVLMDASTRRHRHHAGALYGECVITLAGALNDTLDDGTAVVLRAGTVMFHAADTIHDATADCYWVGIIHQPCGCTFLS